MLKNYIGTGEYAKDAPKSCMWMATSYGNRMALGNVSLVTALKYCVVETLRGNGPCWVSKYGAAPSLLDVLRGNRGNR